MFVLFSEVLLHHIIISIDLGCSDLAGQNSKQNLACNRSALKSQLCGCGFEPP